MKFPETLISRLRAGKLIPFVGAGVPRAVERSDSSVPLFPSWSELLESAAVALERESRPKYAMAVRGMLGLDVPDFLQAAKRAQEGLGPVWFPFLKEQLGHSKECIRDATLDLARSIWGLNSNLIITTNYDRVLEWATDDSDVAAWNIASAAEQAALLRDGVTRRTVWHLHGSIDDAANIILTPDSYDRLYPSNDVRTQYAASVQTLRSLLSSHSILFVGFSFADEAVGTELRALNEAFEGATGPNYAIVHKQQVNAVNSLNIPGIQLLSFDEYGQALTAHLIELGSHVKTSSLVLTSTSASHTTTQTKTPPVTEQSGRSLTNQPPPQFLLP